MNKTNLLMQSEQNKSDKLYSPLAKSNFYLDVANGILSELNSVLKASTKLKRAISSRNKSTSAKSDDVDTSQSKHEIQPKQKVVSAYELTAHLDKKK